MLNNESRNGIFTYMPIFRGGASGATMTLWCLFTAVFLASQVARGQRLTGQVRIEVKDPSGAAVAAAGKLENLSAGTVQQFETDAEGMHSFTGLPLGRYRLEVNATGFATQVSTLNVQSAAPISRTINLSLSAQTVQVEVVGSTPLAGSKPPLPVQRCRS